MSKPKRALYLDTSAVSVYVLPRNEGHKDVLDVLTEAAAQGVDIVSLPLLYAEAAKGGAQAKQRKAAIRRHVTYLPWTPAVKKLTTRILANCPEEQRLDRLADVQHYAAASVNEIPYLVTFDKDFKHIEVSLVPRGVFKPNIVTPAIMLTLLRSGSAFERRNPKKPHRFSMKFSVPSSLTFKQYMAEIRAAKRAYGQAMLPQILAEAGKKI